MCSRFQGRYLTQGNIWIMSRKTFPKQILPIPNVWVAILRPKQSMRFSNETPKRALGWRKSYDLRHDSDATHNVNLSPNLDNPWTSRLSLRWVLGIERIDVLRPRRETQETLVHRPLILAIKNHLRDNSEENVGWDLKLKSCSSLDTIFHRASTAEMQTLSHVDEKEPTTHFADILESIFQSPLLCCR